MTVDRPRRSHSLSEMQKRVNYERNFFEWTSKALKDGYVWFDSEDLVPNYDFAEAVDLAREEYLQRMARDEHGVWRKTSAIEAGSKTVINEELRD